jgi:hypothetical protein
LNDNLAGALSKGAEMTVYKNASMETYYGDGAAMQAWPCQVRLDKGSIAVSYTDDGVSVTYEGTEEGAGHFKLASPAPRGSATLHKFKGAEVLEGWWSEDGHTGMWRIFLE